MKIVVAAQAASVIALHVERSPTTRLYPLLVVEYSLLGYSLPGIYFY